MSPEAGIGPGPRWREGQGGEQNGDQLTFLFQKEGDGGTSDTHGLSPLPPSGDTWQEASWGLAVLSLA